MLAIAHPKRGIAAGFTLIELLLAVAIGSIVAAVAFITLRFIVVTSQRAHRLELENRLLRNGFLDALNDADYWTLYDDPDDPSNQALRLTDTTPTPNPEILWRQTMTYGRPFTPLNVIPTMTGAVGPGGEPLTTSTWVQTSVAIDPTGGTGPDNSNLGCLTGRDQDVGFNPKRAYDASDPCRWYRGDFVPSQPDDKRFGRYAGVTCEVSTPALGFISPNAMQPQYRDAREPGYMDRFIGPLWACTTGPYGTVDSSAFSDGSSHVWTSNPRQIAWLHDVLGSYGICDYLPANTCVAAHGTGIFFNGTQSWVHEMLDQRLVSSTYDRNPPAYANSAPANEKEKARYTSPFAPDNNIFLTYNQNAAATPMAAGWQAYFPLVPISPWTGSTAVGLGGTVVPLNTWTPPEVVHALRYRYYTHDAQDFELQNAIYVATLGKPIMPQRPAHWPSPLLLSQRYATEGRLMAQYRVRFQDSVSGKIVEIGFNALGSTLRGARQQRLKTPASGSGWATFHGADSIGTQTFRGAAPNDPTLDD